MPENNDPVQCEHPSGGEWKNDSYEGYITRQVVEKVLFHQLSGQLVCEYMNSEIHFVSSDADVAEIELKLSKVNSGSYPSSMTAG